MTPSSQNDRAQIFHRLHQIGPVLVLPNAWDPVSARLIEEAGATAIATTSSGVSWANGRPDGHGLTAAQMARAVGDIVAVCTAPVSADIEAGYCDDAATVGETVRAVLDVGAVGVNLEDGTDAPDLLAAKIAAAKEAGVKAGINLFVNARTDVVLRGLCPAEKAVEEILTRSALYQKAGADGLFVPGLAQPEAIRAVAGGTNLPLNVMALPGLPPAEALGGLGVQRLSLGGALAEGAHGWLRKTVTRVLETGECDPAFVDALSYFDLNGLFDRPRA